MKKLALAIIATLSLTLAACEPAATVASRNTSQAADNFEINRRVIFYNGITNDYILNIEGRCSIKVDRSDRQLEVICKVGSSNYKKHFLGISDNVTYFVEQLGFSRASEYHYRVFFRPQTILPDIDFQGSANELVREVR